MRDESPFTDLRRRRDVTWLEPRLVAEASYSEIVEGRLRAAVFGRLFLRLLPALTEARGSRKTWATTVFGRVSPPYLMLSGSDA
jgi:hypothetical protein